MGWTWNWTYRKTAREDAETFELVRDPCMEANQRQIEEEANGLCRKGLQQEEKAWGLETNGKGPQPYRSVFMEEAKFLMQRRDGE